MLKIRYMSDLHIEQSTFTINYDNCDIILLIGDTSSYIEYFNIVLKPIPSHIPVYLILGNHEFDNQFIEAYPTLLEKYLQDNNFHNVHLLHNKFVDIGDVRIIGSTLWSNACGYFDYFNNNDNLQRLTLEATLQNNFLNHLEMFHEKSNLPSKILTVELMKEEFYNSYNFIKESLNTNQKCVVATHFAPYFEAAINGINRPVQPYFSFWANHIPELMGKPQYWLHGHIHSKFQKNINGTAILSNPRGNSSIKNISENSLFNPLATINI